MLVEIESDAFIDAGMPRGAIRFNERLNIIQGDDHGSNSIGKTTFLLAVDYAFGGKAYADDVATRDNVSPHEIRFTFAFQGATYKFSRPSCDINTVWICDEQYSHERSITRPEFNAWLLGMYGMSDLGGSFRSMVSTFFRIYGKDNFHESKPLKTVSSESDALGITRLMELYGEYGRLSVAKGNLEDATKKKSQFRNACNFKLIPIASNKTEKERNERELGKLRAKLSDLETRYEHGLEDADPIVAERTARLKSDLSVLRRRKTGCETQISRIKADKDLGGTAKKANFDKLLEFFPDANITHLQRIESFHKGLANALASERKEQIKQLEKEIAELDDLIIPLEIELAETGTISSVNRLALREFAELSERKGILEKSIDAYNMRNELESAEKTAKSELKRIMDSALLATQKSINDLMSDMNEFACGAASTPPEIHLNSEKSYQLSIPNDTGTGSRFRALVLFDLALMKQTPLPTLAHDSVFLKQIEDPVLLKLMRLYDSIDKQSFVVIDKAASYSELGHVESINRSTVLKLSKGHELFGRSWAVKKGDEG